MTQTSSPTAPELSLPISDRIACIDNAVVVPPAKGLGNQSVQKSGVLRPDGSVVEESITWRGPNRVTIDPSMPKEEDIRHLPGTHMFLGPLFGHFGHFLVESICRIWAFDALRDKIDGVVYVPKFQNRPEHVVNVYRPALAAMGVTAPVLNLDEPTRVDRLYVPLQGFGMFQMIEGAPEFRDFIRTHAGKNVAPRGDKKIYISRSELPAARGSILGEPLLEKWLQDEGYTIFHPQKHDHVTQIAAYRAATHIISVDCSPLHLLALVGSPEQKVGVIARRGGNLDEIFARQITAFQGAEAHPINCLKRNWIEEHANRPSRTSWGEVNFNSVWKRLSDAGLISGATPWPNLTDDQITDEVVRISEGAGVKFKAH